MSVGRFNFEEAVNISRGPTTDGRQAPSGVVWDKTADTPVSGRTPAARNASATGAMAASPHTSARVKRLLLWFLDRRRLTIAEAAVLLDVKEGSVTGPWNRLEHKLGWIVGTGEYYTYALANGRPVRREYHRLTDVGRTIALELQRRGVRR